jgi:predicted O-methyltransferase YrrM
MSDKTSPIEQKKLLDSFFQKPPADPHTFFTLIQDLVCSADTLCAVTAASQLGIFDLLKKPGRAQDIAVLCKYPEMADPLLRILTDIGLLDKNGDTFVCTPIAHTFLTIDSPYNQFPYLEKQIRHLSELWIPLMDILKNGPRMYDEQEFFASMSLPSMAVNALCGRLQDVVSGISALPRFSQCSSLIDLGGGHGLYAIALASLNPGMHATVFDLPEVTPLAKKYISRYGMQERVCTKGGNFFTDDIGGKYDIILSSSNPSGKSIDMLKNIVSHLNDGGYFVNVQPGDTVQDEESVNEMEWLLWSFIGTKGSKISWGKKKSFFTPEYQKSLLETGLSIVSVTQVSDPYMKGYQVTMVIAEKLKIV